MPCALQRVKILQLLLWPAEEKRLAGHKKQKFKKKKILPFSPTHHGIHSGYL